MVITRNDAVMKDLPSMALSVVKPKAISVIAIF